MTNNDELRRGSGDMNAYRVWASQQECQHCGAKASDRKRNEHGAVIAEDWWLTETDCGCTLGSKTEGK